MPDGRTKNQIDHVPTEDKHKKAIKDIRSYSGADADCHHLLVIAKPREELPSIGKTKSKGIETYNGTKLQQAETANTFEQ